MKICNKSDLASTLAGILPKEKINKRNSSIWLPVADRSAGHD